MTLSPDIKLNVQVTGFTRQRPPPRILTMCCPTQADHERGRVLCDIADAEDFSVDWYGADFVAREDGFLGYDVFDLDSLAALLATAGHPDHSRPTPGRLGTHNTVVNPSFVCASLAELQAAARHWKLHLQARDVRGAWTNWPFEHGISDPVFASTQRPTARRTSPHADIEDAWWCFGAMLNPWFGRMAPKVVSVEMLYSDQVAQREPASDATRGGLQTALATQLVRLVLAEAQVKSCANCGQPFFYKKLSERKEQDRVRTQRMGSHDCSERCGWRRSQADSRRARKSGQD